MTRKERRSLLVAAANKSPLTQLAELVFGGRCAVCGQAGPEGFLSFENIDTEEGPPTLASPAAVMKCITTLGPNAARVRFQQACPNCFTLKRLYAREKV